MRLKDTLDKCRTLNRAFRLGHYFVTISKPKGYKGVPMPSIREIMKALYSYKSLLALVFLFHSNLLLSQEYQVDKLDFNTNDAEFSAIPYRDGVIFVSNRSKKRLAAEEDSIHLYYTDLFFSKKKSNGQWTEPALFSNELTGFLNEGPATFNKNGNTLYYTGNMEPTSASKRKKTKEYKLGLFKAEYINGIWNVTEPFPFNSANQQFNIAHPAFSPDDSTLYFASNMPGGIGGADLYKCVWRNGRWSLPINLGNTVNTRGDELFPYVSKSGKLFFTSNGYDDSEGFDVYFSYIVENKYQEAVRLPEPINSPLDDFSYCESKGGNNGYLSSNRESENDDVYLFKSDMPALVDCNDNQRTNYCFHMEEEHLLANDSLPLAFEWNLGDGNIVRGKTIDHCYAEEGYYQVSLDLIDTISNTRFYSVSKGEVVIKKLESPYIIGPTEAMVSQDVIFQADGSDISIFQVEEYYWVIDDEIKYSGPEVSTTFDTPGFHTIVCGAFSKIGKGGIRSSICTYRQIFVTPDSTEYAVLAAIEDFKIYQPVEMIQCIGKYEVRHTSPEASLAPYYAVLFESKVKMDPNDPAVKVEGYTVNEFKTTDGYIYAIGPEESPYDLYTVYEELGQNAPEKIRIEQIDDQLVSRITPIGASKLKIMGLKSPEAVAIKSTYQVMLKRSNKALNSDDPIFANKDIEIRGFKLEDEWVYTTGSSTSYESIQVTFEEIQSQGQTDAQIVYFDGSNFKTIIPENLKPSNSLQPMVQAGDSIFHLAILRSPISLALTDKYFKKVDGKIIECPVMDGFVYVVEGSTSYESVHTLFEKLAEDGYDNAEIVTFDGIDFHSLLQESEETVEEISSSETGPPTKGNYQVLIRKSDVPLLPEKVVPGNIKFKLSEIKNGDTYLYTAGNATTIEQVMPIFEELENQGLQNLQIVQFNGTEFVEISELASNANSSVAENPANKTVGSNPVANNETSIDGRSTQTEVNTTNTLPSYHILLNEDDEGKKAISDLPPGLEYNVVKGKDNPYFMYITSGKDAPELLSSLIGELRKSGYPDVQIVKFDGVNYTKANEKGISFVSLIEEEIAASTNASSIAATGPNEAIAAETATNIESNQSNYGSKVSSTENPTSNTNSIEGQNQINTTESTDALNVLKGTTTGVDQTSAVDVNISGNSASNTSVNQESGTKNNIDLTNPENSATKISKPTLTYYVLVKEDANDNSMPLNIPSNIHVIVRPNGDGTGYLYLADASDNPESLAETVSALRKAGIDNISVVQHDGVVYTKANENGTAFIELVPDSSPTSENVVSNTTIPGKSRNTMYHIVIKESESRIPFNDPIFSSIEEPIIEIKCGDTYKYIVGGSNQREKLHPLLEKVSISSDLSVHIEEYDQQEFTSMITKTGEYIAPKDAEVLNIEFAKLSDIKFEYNSADIREDSKQVLNYISAMLILEEDFLLRINAHTCSQGGGEYNQELSERRAESVRNYFINRGIDGTRLLKKGFGESRPLVDNTEELGRMQNRRVEFIIIFPDNGQSSWLRSNN